MESDILFFGFVCRHISFFDFACTFLIVEAIYFIHYLIIITFIQYMKQVKLSQMKMDFYTRKKNNRVINFEMQAFHSES